jgi:Regulator of chromosome condensation (RCC1) repeat
VTHQQLYLQRSNLSSEYTNYLHTSTTCAGLRTCFKKQNNSSSHYLAKLSLPSHSFLLACAQHSIGTGTAVAVKCGDDHVCILRADNTTTASNSGEVLCWGSNVNGILVSFECAIGIPRKAPLFG